MVRFNFFQMTGKYRLEPDDSVQANRLPQYLAALTAGLSSMAFGSVLAWTSPAGPQLGKGSVGFPVTTDEISIIGSSMTLGAAVSSIPTGYITDRFGRKNTMLALVPIWLFGWSLIIWPENVEMIYAGRLITGMCGGAICVVCPVFMTEIAQKEIRGELVSYFQLLMALGITLTYIVGSQLHVFYLSIICASIVVLFLAGFVFFPETPVYYMKKGLTDDAKKSLGFYRGPNYNVDLELKEIRETLKRKSGEEKEESLMEVFMSRRGLKAFFIAIGLMSFQQLSGINAVTFYSTNIFEAAGSSLEPKYATVVVGCIQLIGTMIGMLFADRLGRVILLVTSSAAMTFSMFLLGLYFYLKGNGIDTPDLTWLPLVSVCTFAVMFSVGYGPIPWAVMPEVCPSRIVGLVCSLACVINWIFAFIVTKFFINLVELIGPGFTFWIFVITGIFATGFSWRAVPETKGKSLEEIQKALSE